MKEKLRSKSFWLSLVGALLVLLQALGFTLDVPAINEIVSAGLALLVVLGIISNNDGAPPAAADSVTADFDESGLNMAATPESAENTSAVTEQTAAIESGAKAEISPTMQIETSDTVLPV